MKYTAALELYTYLALPDIMAVIYDRRFSQTVAKPPPYGRAVVFRNRLKKPYQLVGWQKFATGCNNERQVKGAVIRNRL